MVYRKGPKLARRIIEDPTRVKPGHANTLKGQLESCIPGTEPYKTIEEALEIARSLQQRRKSTKTNYFY